MALAARATLSTGSAGPTKATASQQTEHLGFTHRGRHGFQLRQLLRLVGLEERGHLRLEGLAGSFRLLHVGLAVGLGHVLEVGAGGALLGFAGFLADGLDLGDLVVSEVEVCLDGVGGGLSAGLLGRCDACEDGDACRYEGGYESGSHLGYCSF